MNRRITTLGLISCVLSSAFVATVSYAQTAEPAAPAAEAAPKTSPEASAPATDAPATAEQTPAEDGAKAAERSKSQEMVDEAQAGDSAAELPDKTYYFVGARYRGIIVPKFIQNLFADGGRTVYVNGFGPEFGIRKNGFEYSLSPWLALYNMSDTGFKGKNDGEAAWEIVSTKIQMLYLTSDFLWSHEFTPEVALNYGVGAGLGIVFGNVYRNQSYPVPGGSTDPNDYAKCNAPGSPSDVYCDASNQHYGNYTEPSWANGGSKPVVFPWLTLQTGLRFKPSKSFAARLDLGFGTSGFFFGVGADYGL